MLALVALAPAAWLAAAVAGASEQRLLLADARGTVWAGSAVPVLTGGAGSRDASALPGRLHWRLGLDGGALALRATPRLLPERRTAPALAPGWAARAWNCSRPRAAGRAGRHRAVAGGLAGGPGHALEHAAALGLDPRSRARGWSLESVQGRWLFDGRAEIELDAMASRISTLDELGSYRLVLQGDAAGGEAAPLCGYVADCPNCSVSLTYHRHEQKLCCHICGHTEPVPAVCPNANAATPQSATPASAPKKSRTPSANSSRTRASCAWTPTP